VKIGDLVVINEDCCMEKDLLCVVVERCKRKNAFKEDMFRVVPVNKEFEIKSLLVCKNHIKNFSEKH